VTIPTGVRSAALAAVLAVAACGLLPGHRATPPAAVDVNRASRGTLERLPGITPSMARRIIEGRPYQDPEELVARGILTERELHRISDRVTGVGH